MVEKESIERISVPVTESNTRALEQTTLAGLGIDTSFDTLNLAGDGFRLGVKKVGGDTVFVGLLKHPLAGVHFAQFLNSVAPFRDQDRYGIEADVDLPIRAGDDYQLGKDKTTSKFIRLHERHLGDPRVGPTYIRFIQDHVDPWLMALKFDTGEEVFDRLQKIRFINSAEDVRKELFSEDGNIINSLKDSKVLLDMKFVLQILEHNRFNRRSENVLGKSDKEIEAVLGSLTKEDQKEFAMSYFVYRKRQILVDLDTHRIMSDKNNANDRTGKGKVRFVDNSRNVLITDKKGTSVVIRPTGQNSERFSWKVIKYQFPENYVESGLYPVIAWKRDGNGTRSFLTQKEAMFLIEELDLPERGKGDTKLGEIVVAYFTRDIIEKWPARMKLAPLEETTSRRGDDFEQPMRGGQMPAWVAVEQHIGHLLKSETSPLAIMEKRLGLTA